MPLVVLLMLARVTGFAREIVAAGYFGVRGPMSAFVVAYRLPGLLASLLSDSAIQAGVVPAFSAQLAAGNRRAVFALVSSLLFVMTLGLGLLTVVFTVVAPYVVPLFSPGFATPLQDLTVNLAQIVFPLLLLLSVFGLLAGLLNSFDRFSVPALALTVSNVLSIGTLVVLAPQVSAGHRIYAYAVALLVGAIGQLAFPLPWLRRIGFTLRRRQAVDRRQLLEIFRVMLPVGLVAGIVYFNLAIDTVVATLVSSQAPAVIERASRILTLPLAFAAAIATVRMPTMARLAAAGKPAEIAGVLTSGLRQTYLTLAAMAAVLVVLSEPITRIIYQRGTFDASQTMLVSRALAVLSVALPFWGVNLIFQWGFFSLLRAWTAVRIGLANLLLNAVLDLVLYKQFGIAGITWGTVIATASTTIVLIVVMRRSLAVSRLGITRPAVATTAAALASAGAALAVWRVAGGASNASLAVVVLKLSAALVAGGAAYVGALHALGVDDLAAAARRIHTRVVAARQSASRG